MIRFVIAMVVAVGACAKASDTGAPGKAEMHTFKVLPAAATAPLTVEAAIPAGWSIPDPASTSPELKVPGVDRGLISIAALSLSGTPEERMAAAIKAQYEDGAGVERTDLPDGRRWLQRVEGSRLHARLFIPYGDGVVMGVALIPQAAADQLPAIRKVFETIKVTAH